MKDELTNKIKVIVVSIMLIALAVGIFIASNNAIVESTDTQKFYISEANELFTQRKYYVLINEELKLEATDPELIEYCKNHTGETVNIKFNYTYDKFDEEYESIDFISIEEDK